MKRSEGKATKKKKSLFTRLGFRRSKKKKRKEEAGKKGKSTIGNT